MRGVTCKNCSYVVSVWKLSNFEDSSKMDQTWVIQFDSVGIYLFKVHWWQHQKNVWNMFKVNNKHTRTTSLTSHTSFWFSHYWPQTSKCRLLKDLKLTEIYVSNHTISKSCKKSEYKYEFNNTPTHHMILLFGWEVLHLLN